MKHKIHKTRHFRILSNALLILMCVLTLSVIYILMSNKSSVKATTVSSVQSNNFWSFQSIDTMKYSRDLSREKLKDPVFDLVIDDQVKKIADTGATHIGIATPYDDEFLPVLQRWVKAARQHNMKIWFRGNFSGWEKWFDYPGITRKEHIAKTKRFIEMNADLFEDGDVFSACPECENGGPGDPRMIGDTEGHKKFLIDEYKVTKEAFKKIHKDVASNYNSMNGDVARLIMDRETTKALDGLVVIDHYVSTNEKMKRDLEEISELSGGKIILGEFGAPILDLQGQMSEVEQAAWLAEVMKVFIDTKSVVGLNYWTSTGGSTQLWTTNGVERQAVGVLASYYLPTLTSITIENPLGQKIKNAIITIGARSYLSDEQGIITLPQVLLPSENVTIEADTYTTKTGLLEADASLIVLEKTHEDLAYKIVKLFYWTLNLPRSN